MTEGLRTRAEGFIQSTEEKGDLNQYWYSAPTIAALIEEVEAHEDVTKVAFLSTPSVWFAMPSSPLKKASKFFDLDTDRWSTHKNFVCFDFNKVDTYSRCHGTAHRGTGAPGNR